MKFGNIYIGNKRSGAAPPRKDTEVIHVDRVNPILGNKYILEDYRDDIKRAEVLSKYKADYDADWERDGPMKQETLKIARKVYKGKSVSLLCWCAGAPTFRACHAEFIKYRIEEVLKPYLNS